MADDRSVILYHYTYSPYARRVVWYLHLRQIPYTQCLQPPYLPRPDVTSLGTSYRRIPLLSIGRDIYTDTRLIIHKLSLLFPPPLYPSLSSNPGLEKLLETWAVDGGLFVRASQLIPTNVGLMQDEKFRKDREDFSGRSWEVKDAERARPEALVEIRRGFDMLETTFLRDGREWIAGGEGPTLADIEGIWPFHWLTTLKGALPPDYISATTFPKVFAWIARFNVAIKAAAAKVGKARTLTGPEALAAIEKSGFAEEEGIVDEQDPSKLRKGDLVEAWPTDSGTRHRDRGLLVKLDGEEVVILGKTGGGVEVRIHCPRHGFRVRKIEGSKL